MRRGTILAAFLSTLAATSAHAEGWCGYATRDHAMVECGYSTVAQCETAIGKGGMCFIDPDYALNSRYAAPAVASKAAAGRG